MTAIAGFTENMKRAYKALFVEGYEVEQEFIGFFELGVFALNRINPDIDIHYDQFATIMNNWEQQMIWRRKDCVFDMIARNRQLFEDTDTLVDRELNDEEADDNDEDSDSEEDDEDEDDDDEDSEEDDEEEDNNNNS